MSSYALKDCTTRGDGIGCVPRSFFWGGSRGVTLKISLFSSVSLFSIRLFFRDDIIRCLG